jgi:MoxR-like ATPase
MAKGICFTDALSPIEFDDSLWTPANEHYTHKIKWIVAPQTTQPIVESPIVEQAIQNDPMIAAEVRAITAEMDQFPQDVTMMHQSLGGLSNIMFEREETLKALYTMFIARATGIVYGGPGQGKSDMIRVASESLDRSYWNTTISAFSSLDDLIGPVDLIRMREEKVSERAEKGLLTHDIVFLDELGNSSPPIRDAIKTIINERTYQNGERLMELPLQSLIAASNSQLLDHTATEEAFADRFLIRLVTQPIQDPANVVRMMKGRFGRPEVIRLAPDVLDRMQALVRTVKMSDEFLLGAEMLRRQIRSEPAAGALEISERRMFQTMDIVAAHALLQGRKVAKRSDLIVFGWTLWSDPETEMLPLQEYLKTVLMNQLMVVESYRNSVNEIWAGWREIVDSKSAPLSAEEVMKIGIRNRNELEMLNRQLSSIRPKLEDQDETDLANAIEKEIAGRRDIILKEMEDYEQSATNDQLGELDAIKKA